MDLFFCSLCLRKFFVALADADAILLVILFESVDVLQQTIGIMLDERQVIADRIEGRHRECFGVRRVRVKGAEDGEGGRLILGERELW